jgi:heme-degrading monooxygenase HmoA
MNVIVRIWRGRTPADKSDSYVDYLKQTGVKEYREKNGNRGVQLLRRVQGDTAEFLTVTWWDSYEAIQRFAGEDIEQPVYYPEDKEFLLEFEDHVDHYEVVVQEQ